MAHNKSAKKKNSSSSSNGRSFITLCGLFVVVLPILFVLGLWFYSTPVKYPSQIFYKKGIVFGHNGGGDDVPEDTLMSIRYSKEKGATGVEVDIRSSADGILIAFHDPTLNRTTDGSGLVSSYDFETLQKFDAGYHWPEHRGKGVKIPKIEDVVSLITELELFPSLLEIKDGKDEKIPELVSELFKKNPVLYEHVVIMSFFPNQLVRLRSVDPNITTTLLVAKDSLSMMCEHKFLQNEVLCWMAPALDKGVWWLNKYVIRHLLGIGGISVKHTTAIENMDLMRDWQTEGLFLNIYHLPKDEIKNWANTGISVTPNAL